MCRAVKESRDRVSTALTNSGFKIPTGWITINLAPADVKKEGPVFDLPIAIGMLAGNDQLMSDQLGNLVVVGKLALTGSVSILKAKLPIAKLARALEVSPRFAIFSIVSGVVCCYFLPDTIYDLERTSLTLWAPSV
jgi:predicted ATPase with chaperone activity